MVYEALGQLIPYRKSCQGPRRRDRSNKVVSLYATRLTFVTLVLVYTQGFVFVPGSVAQSVSDQVSELLYRQLEVKERIIPSPEAPLVPSDDIADTPPAHPEETPSDGTTDNLPAPPVKIERILPKVTAGKELIRATAMLIRFYEGRAYRPAWSNDTGPLHHAETLIKTIQEEAEREGLNPRDYRLTKIKTLLEEVWQRHGGTPKPLNPRMLADLDLLLTDTFLTYGAYVSTAQVNLDTMDARWFEKHREADLVQVLQTALDANCLEEAIKSLPPQQSDYTRLRGLLARYRNIVAQGGWPTVPAGPRLRKGDRDARVVKLRVRLQASGDLGQKSSDDDTLFDAPPNGEESRGRSHNGKEIFDETLEQAVRKFQQRHGLNADGVVGAETLAALNVSAQTRAQQIAKNMERWRLLPQDLGQRYIAVNIPNFTLEVVEENQPVIDMKVVVGKMMERQNTPVFSAKMTHLVLNPYWYVPKTIAEKELFPLSRKNPQYFTKHNFTVRRIPAGEKLIPDPNAMDGSMISVKTYQYLLRQGPGPKNALGRVKFMFPNAYSVYLHDTPSKELFNRTVRTFSHGCIRIEKPIDLAEYALRRDAKWTRDTILTAIEQQKERTVWLPEPIPVYIQYWTAWVDEDGTVQFRNDIYGYDRLPGTQVQSAKPRKPRPEAQPKVQPEIQPIPQPDPQPVTQPKTQPAM